MKNLYLILAILLIDGQIAFAQSDQNYVRTHNYRTERPTLPNEVTSLGLTKEEVSIQTQYFDGFGRPIQTVNKQASPSPSSQDIVQHIDYDAYGRQVKSFLPYVSGSNGLYKTGADVSQITFYDTHFNDDSGDYAFSEQEFEKSPLNRVVNTYAPGQSWANPNTVAGGGDKPISFHYQTNATGEVKLWLINAAGIPYLNGDRAPGQLKKNIIIDENDNEVHEFKDKLDRIVLKRVGQGALLADTYYLYDDLNNLRYVLPPKITGENIPIGLSNEHIEYVPGEDLVFPPSPGPGEYYVDEEHSITLTPDFEFTATSNDEFLAGIGNPAMVAKFNDLAFEYHYDERHRMIAKKVPGAAWIYMVYDQWDRLVLTQDGNLRENDEWLFTKYDAFNRPIMTGITTDSRSQHDIQSSLMLPNNPNRGESRSLLPDNVEEYDNACYPSNHTNSNLDGFVKEILTVTYYDSYPSFAITGDLAFQTVSTYVSDDSSLSSTHSIKSNNVKGQVTATKTKVLETEEDYLLATNFYDDRYRLIQTKAQNNLDGYDRVSYNLDFIGQVEKSDRYHYTLSAGGHVVKDNFTYDHVGRLMSSVTNIHGKSSTINHSYNKLGELTIKDMNGAQTVDYAYNIHGWLTAINNPMSLGSDKFAMELLYEDSSLPANIRQYNGNIGQIKWKNAFGPNQNLQDYTYSYDALNRLKSAAYESDLKPGHFNVFINYDLNGNISTLDRKMDNNVIDILTYGYGINPSNQLKSVTDASVENASAGFDDVNKIGDDYVYDANGNMKEDKNKGILISYNYLNLPSTVTTSAGVIHYTYDAVGTKLRKYYDKSLEETTDYIGGIQYEDGALDFAQHSEGRFLFVGDSYEYNLTDHLGNVRATVDATGTEVKQSNDYYPYGLTFNHGGGDDNKYKYNGFEEQGETGLYDYQARFYDPALGRFINVDPAADLMRRYSTYAYAFDNPVRFTDPDGMVPSTSTGFSNGFNNDLDYNAIAYSVDHSVDPGSGGGGGSGNDNVNQELVQSGNEALEKNNQLIDQLGSDTNQANGGMPAETSLIGGDGLQNQGPDFYYNAIDGMKLPDGTVLSRDNVALEFLAPMSFYRKYHGTAGNANYMRVDSNGNPWTDGKHHVNFNIGDYEVTAGNIRAVMYHEVYGHGIQGVSGFADQGHYKAYFTVMDNRSIWGGTTSALRSHFRDNAYASWIKTNPGKPYPGGY